jgi:hypothetical protein
VRAPAWGAIPCLRGDPDAHPALPLASYRAVRAAFLSDRTRRGDTLAAFAHDFPAAAVLAAYPQE